MSENIKISVILPVYNVEKYLHESLDSIINQTYKNLEIICVNDGSTDNSLEILNQYAQKDSRIVVISQENKSQGAARNTGLNAATGDYISFIDPDDWIVENAYETIVEKIKELNPDILQFEYEHYIEASQEYRPSTLNERFKKNFNIDLKNKDSYSFSDFNKKDFLKIKGSSCNKIYKHEFLIKNNIKFLSHRSGEDTIFNLKLLLCTDKIHLMHKVLYTYRKKTFTCVKLNNNHDTRYILEQVDYIKELLQEHNLYNEMQNEFSKYKLRTVYEADKNCSNEFKAEFLKIAKEKLTFLEYIKFLFRKNVSKLLRNLFFIKKNVYIGDTKNIVVVILGVKIVLKSK